MATSWELRKKTLKDDWLILKEQWNAWFLQELRKPFISDTNLFHSCLSIRQNSPQDSKQIIFILTQLPT